MIAFPLLCPSGRRQACEEVKSSRIAFAEREALLQLIAWPFRLSYEKQLALILGVIVHFELPSLPIGRSSFRDRKSGSQVQRQKLCSVLHYHPPRPPVPAFVKPHSLL